VESDRRGTAALSHRGKLDVYARSAATRDGHDARLATEHEDLSAFGEARLAALKAGLCSRPERRRTGRHSSRRA